MSDFYYAYPSGNVGAICSGTTCPNCLIDSSNDAWTMTRAGAVASYSGYIPWKIFSNGRVDWYYSFYEYAVRPTFYLNKDVYITNPEATGTSTDPFILSY